eukprot:4825445-Amphidinium_carterae.1
MEQVRIRPIRASMGRRSSFLVRSYCKLHGLDCTTGKEGRISHVRAHTHTSTIARHNLSVVVLSKGSRHDDNRGSRDVHLIHVSEHPLEERFHQSRGTSAVHNPNPADSTFDRPLW